MAFATNFKGPRVSTKVRRRLKRDARDAREEKAKREVRSREMHRCRFPKCGCKRFGLAQHVAHLEHKGMGGNPKEDRSDPSRMVNVCIARHREHVFSIDKGTIRCRPLTSAGTNGPVAWDIDVAELIRYASDQFAPPLHPVEDWLEVARELNGAVLETQSGILAWLGEMRF